MPWLSSWGAAHPRKTSMSQWLGDSAAVPPPQVLGGWPGGEGAVALGSQCPGRPRSSGPGSALLAVAPPTRRRSLARGCPEAPRAGRKRQRPGCRRPRQCFLLWGFLAPLPGAGTALEPCHVAGLDSAVGVDRPLPSRRARCPQAGVAWWSPHVGWTRTLPFPRVMSHVP